MGVVAGLIVACCVSVLRGSIGQTYYSLVVCRTQYSAERMNLVILGGEALETLEAWARELFSPVPNGKGPSPQFAAESMPFEVGYDGEGRSTCGCYRFCPVTGLS